MARRLCKIRTHQNVEVYGRSEDEAQRKCILQAEKHYAWAKKTLRRTFVSLGKTVFSPCGRKKQPFFLRKQKFASEFFCPWHNVSSQKEHIFFFQTWWVFYIDIKRVHFHHISSDLFFLQEFNRQDKISPSNLNIIWCLITIPFCVAGLVYLKSNLPIKR